MNRDQFLHNKPLIYLITAGKATPENFSEQKKAILELILTAVESKISLIQIREKNLPAASLLDLASEAAKITARTKTKILVNDRADVALAAGAAGVHLRADSLAAATIRRCFPPDFIIGVSVHTVAEAEKAEAEKANFVTFSPIFATASKENFGAPHGLKKLRDICRKLGNFPVIALGGISKNNYKSTLENGARGFAAIRFLNDAENLKKVADFSAETAW